MKSSNQEKIRNAFTQQAAGFESSKMNFSNQAYLDYAVSRIAPAKTDHVLEVAAGNSSADPGENAVEYFGRPYDCDGEIRFDHRWVLIVGTTKPQTGSGKEI